MFQEVEASRFQDSWHMKVVRLLALHTGHLYRPGNVTGYSFISEVDSTPGAILWPEGMCQ